MKSTVQYSTYQLTAHLSELSYTQKLQNNPGLQDHRTFYEMSRTVKHVSRTNKCIFHSKKIFFGALAILNKTFPCHF